MLSLSTPHNFAHWQIKKPEISAKLKHLLSALKKQREVYLSLRED